MMAKMFYTMDETKNVLGRSEEEIKQLAREGRLREFRDGPRLMFKADQVDQLKADIGTGGGGDVSLGPSDSGSPITLADVTGGSSGGVTLADSKEGHPALEKEGTQFADIGLSGTIGGSVGGVPSPGRLAPTGSGSGLSGTAAGSHVGINVFDLDEGHGHADPGAQTSMGSGIQDNVNLEGVGSGSGLLDLTKESDDTSLGAVFEDLAPAGRGGRSAPSMLEGSSVAMPGIQDSGSTAPGRRVIATGPSAPIFVEAPDPWATAFGGAALAATIIVCFGAFLVACAVMEFKPAILKDLGERGPVFLLGAIGGIIVFTLGGLIIGKATAR